MNKEKVYIREFLATLWRYKAAIIIIMVISTSFFIGLSFKLKKKYQADFSINVYSKYFNNPLTNQSIGGVYQVPEMRATINAMIHEALNNEFYDELPDQLCGRGSRGIVYKAVNIK